MFLHDLETSNASAYGFEGFDPWDSERRERLKTFKAFDAFFLRVVKSRRVTEAR